MLLFSAREIDDVDDGLLSFDVIDMPFFLYG